MSYVPFLLCLGLLGRVIRRELGSTTTALVAVAAFSLSSLDSEVIYWYSASSFSWALLWTLLALGFAGSASRSGGGRGAGGLGDGLGDGPGLLGDRPPGRARSRRSGWALDARPRSPRMGRLAWIVPPMGTVAYLAVCAAFRYQDVLSSSVERRADFGSGMIYVLCAPTNVLLPGLLGLNPVELGPSLPLNLGLAALGLVGILAWAIRSPHRSMILGGLWLVLCGYAMTYCFRTQRFGAAWLFRVERYHLFPMVGFTFWTALASRRWLGRYDGRPLASLAVANVVAALLLATHLPSILAHSRVSMISPVSPGPWRRWSTRCHLPTGGDHPGPGPRRAGADRPGLEPVRLPEAAPALGGGPGGPRPRGPPDPPGLALPRPTARRSGAGWTSRLT